MPEQFPDYKTSYAGIFYRQMIADTWDSTGVFQSALHFNDKILSLYGKMGYTSLGSFEFVESDNQAYGEVSSVIGYEYSLQAGAVFSCMNISAGIEGEAGHQTIGGIQQWTDSGGGCFIGYSGWFGEIYGKAGYQDEIVSGECGYSYDFYYEKACICIGCFYSEDINRIIKIRTKIENYKKDLKLNIIYKVGLIYQVYDYLIFMLNKRIGRFEYSVSFTPSLCYNNLFSIGVTYYFQNSKNDYELY